MMLGSKGHTYHDHHQDTYKYKKTIPPMFRAPANTHDVCSDKCDCTEHKREGQDDEVPLSHLLVKTLGKRMRDKLCEDHHNPENKTEN